MSILKKIKEHKERGKKKKGVLCISDYERNTAAILCVIKKKKVTVIPVYFVMGKTAD